MAANTQTGDKQLKLKAKDFMLLSQLIDSLLGNVPRASDEAVALAVLEELREKILKKCLGYRNTPNKEFSIKMKSYQSLALQYMVEKIEWITFDAYTMAFVSRLQQTFNWIDNGEC